MYKIKTVSAEEVKLFLNDDEVIAKSYRENKWLTTSFYGVLKVTVAGKIIYKGKNIDKAVKAYNSITEKYINPTENFKI